MSKGGWIKLYRSIFDSPDFRDSEMSEREAFMWMVCQCSWKEQVVRFKGAIVGIERGEFVTSIRDMAEQFQWPKSRVDRWILRLKKRDTVGTRSGTSNGTRYTVVSICKYDDYQAVDTESGTGSGTPHFSKPGQYKEKKEEPPFSREEVLPSSKKEPIPENSQTNSSKSDASAPARESGGGLSSEIGAKGGSFDKLHRHVGLSVSQQAWKAFRDSVRGETPDSVVVSLDWWHGQDSDQPKICALAEEIEIRIEPEQSAKIIQLKAKGA